MRTATRGYFAKRRVRVATISNSIFINATPESVETWFSELPRNYNSWHPAHAGFEVTDGEITSTGAAFHFEEILHGKHHQLDGKVTGVSRDSGIRIDYKVTGLGYRLLGMKGSFAVTPESRGCLFTATISVWPPAWASQMLFGARLNELEQHMREEGENLKIILERANPPYEI